MRPTARACWALLVIALAACGNLSGATPAAEPTAAVAATVEQGGRFIALTSPRAPHAEPFLGVPGTNFYALRSMIDTRSGETTHQLYVEDSYFGPERNWSGARDAAGQPLRFIAISKNEITCENGCSYAEEFAAAIPEALLRASPQGLTVTFTARSGAQKTIAVPAELIAKQVAALDNTRSAAPTAAAKPSPATPQR